MGTWLNDDGLYIKYGTSEGVTGTAGSPVTFDNLNMVQVEITATDLGANPSILNDHVVIPSGVRIHKVEVIAQTAATSGGSAVLNIGLIRLDRSTELDYNGFVAAAPVADFAADGNIVEYTQGSDEHGALVGTTLANPGLLTADYDTAAFTAGVFLVKVWFYTP